MWIIHSFEYVYVDRLNSHRIFSMAIFICIFFLYLFFYLNVSMRFDDVTIYVFWYISSSGGAIIIKTTVFIYINNFFILRLRSINFILNVVIQII